MVYSHQSVDGTLWRSAQARLGRCALIVITPPAYTVPVTVSDALLRLKQASPNQQLPQQALLIKVQMRYIVCPYRYQLAKHSRARNSNGSRSSASRKPKGVLREFLRSQFTTELYI